MQDWLGNTDITLDALGRPLAVTDSYGQTVGYEWGSMGEKKALTYPDGTRAAYEYDEAMHLSKLHTPTGEITYEYDKAGRLCEKQYPSGVMTQYAYNSLGRIAQISHEGENVHERYIYHYDAAGNKVGADKTRGGSVTWKESTSCKKESIVNGNTLDSGSYRYAYDALNRLVGVEKNGNTQREYTYDAFGNRTKKVDYTISAMVGGDESGFETTLYQYNNANQLITEQLYINKTADLQAELPWTAGLCPKTAEKTYRYDRRGNLTAVNQGEELLKQFTFDPANRMSQSAGNADGIWKQAVYQYNGLGQRVGQDIGNLPKNPEQSIRYTLDFTKQYHNLLHLGDIQNGKAQTFYWDGNVVSMQEDGEESFYLQDDLGSSMELLNTAGGIRESYAFDEFGVSLVERNGYMQISNIENGIVPNEPYKPYEQLQPFGFTGYQTDVAGGLYFAQARRYDASAGRFISEDKVKGFADAPFTLNPYSYCWNKPMELVDLNGLAPTAGVTAAMGEELNGQTHPTGPTAGVTSDIGDALSAGGYSGNTSSCDNEGVAWDEVGNYFEKTLNQLIYGNFTDDITALGVIVEVGLGIFELDFPMDVRDLLADIYLCEEGEQSGWWILLDIIALIPIIGALKYSDEVETLVKRVEWKKIWKDISDSCSSDVKKISDNFKELWEKGSKKISGLGDDIQKWWKKGDELVEEAGETGKRAANAAENSSLNALTGVMEGGQEAAEHTQANDLWSLADELKGDQKAAEGAAESNGAVLTEVLEGDTAAVDDVVTNNANITDDVIESGSYSHKQNLDGLNEVRKHLTNDVDGLDFEPNKAMMEKIEEMLSNSQELTGAYKDFYEHELTESVLMKQGYGYNDAHNMALEIHNVQPQALYSPEIVQEFSKWFNKSDYEYWGITIKK